MQARNTDLDNLYHNCTKTKGCFGMPGGCVERKSCDHMVTYRTQGSNQIIVELMRNSEGYVAFGFSKDSIMVCFTNVHPYPLLRLESWLYSMVRKSGYIR